MNVVEQYDVGVIVARFQVAELHEAHRAVIDSVMAAHDKVLLFLGLSPVRGTFNNPLDFEARKQMVLEAYPSLTVLYINDVGDDTRWSERLDSMIQDQLTPSQTAVLYGGRDSFLPKYTGRLPTRELKQERWVSGSELRRNEARSSPKGSADWRRGAIWAASNRFPTTFTTVDVALMSQDGLKLLLAKKRDEPLYRFVGGFSDPRSPSFEADAVREVSEETGLEIAPPVYIGSMPVDDWRYRGEVDKLKTLLFTADVLFGSPSPGDDLAGGELRWFSIEDLPESHVMPSHRPLLRTFRKHLWTCSECGMFKDHKLQCSRRGKDAQAVVSVKADGDVS